MHRRGLAGAVALVAALAGVLTVVTSPPASAVPVDVGWAANGPGQITDVSDGTASAARFSYSLQPAGLGQQRTWTFSAVAAQSGQVKVPYTWQGLHAWYNVTTTLETFVTHPSSPGVPDTLTLLVSEGNSCCQSPSNGFIYGGVATFNVDAGETYGFRLSGSNSDYNNFLRGTLTLSTKPYLDATIGTDNRDWSGARPLPAAPEFRSLNQAGEARWFTFPVVPGQDVQVKLSGLSKDYDLALYGDIQAAYDALSGDAAGSASGTSTSTGVSDTQGPGYPEQFTDIPTQQTSQQFAPRIYAPRIYAPRIYAPRIYAPNSYLSNLVSDPSFQEAYSAAQNQTLLAISDKPGTAAEEVNAASGNTNGNFYVRVQAHDEADFALNTPFTVTYQATGSGCTSLSAFDDPDDPDTPALMPPVDAVDAADPTTVILTDSERTDYEVNAEHVRIGSPAGFLTDLGTLATARDGVVVDLAGSPRVQALWDQASTQSDCPYAVNLVADAIDQIVETLQGDNTKYVVLAGGDEVVPFFRYPDLSGLGQESTFSPPMRPGTASYGSLARDQVLSQDAYGSQIDVTIAGATLPVPQLAVGRLVKTDQEIASTIDNFLNGGSVITPTSSLVTGYDFLTDAARAVNTEFTGAVGQGGTADSLISDNGAPNDPDYLWDADALEQELLGGPNHDLVFLAGHFSANDAQAADFDTALDASALAPDGLYPDHLKNTLVLSAGCHSGYNIVDQDAEQITNTQDWTQRMAQQHALLIGGTGYQYGDTDFLEYSERLYLEIARRLHDTTGGPIAVGSALVLAKQDYLSGLTAVSGIDQKALLQATLYGLPMTGVDAPGRTSLSPEGSTVDPLTTGREPGDTLGLRVADHTYNTVSPDARHSKTLEHEGNDLELTWIQGQDGVVVQPGVPALPKQIENVSVGGASLRGVGFLGGSYKDTTGLFPLTGAPAIEGATPNTTFESSSFFPQSLTTANYFGTLGTSGRTSLILTPAQYRTDRPTDPSLPTNTERAYSSMGVRLFYTGNDAASAQVAGAAPPAITDVRGTYSGTNVTFSAQVTGDPASGVQQVWVTYTHGPNAQGVGTWESQNLVQDPNDSTRWTLTMPLGGRSAGSLKFLVQAASGAGAVSLDTADGDGYGLADANALPATVFLRKHDATPASPLGVTAGVVTTAGLPVAGRTVRFQVLRNGQPLFGTSGVSGVSGADGSVELTLPAGKTRPPVGDLHVVAELLGSSSGVEDSDETDVNFSDAPVTISSTTPPFLTVPANTAYAGAVMTATVRDDYGTVPSYPVTFVFPTGGASASFVGPANTRFKGLTTSTNASGVASTPNPFVADAVPGSFYATITAGTTTAQVPMAAQYGISTFGSPVNNGANAVNGGSGSLPLKFSVLLPSGAAISDTEASGLLGRVQLRWRVDGSTGAWSENSTLAVYDPTRDLFTIDLKTTALGMKKNSVFQVQVRILPAAAGAKPSPYDAANSDFHLGLRQLRVKAEK